MSRPGRNRHITSTSGETFSTGQGHTDTKIPEHETTNEAVVITCKGDAPSKSDFLANPPKKIIFRVHGFDETVCTRLENKEQWVTYLLDITGKSIYNVLFIFKEPCDKQIRLVERMRLPGYWQIIPIDPIISDSCSFPHDGRDSAPTGFALIGFNLNCDFKTSSIG